MKQVTTLFLKLAVIFIGIPVLALCIFLVPKIGNFAGELYPDIAYMKSLVFIVMYGAAIPFYFALYQAFKLLSYIDKNTSVLGIIGKGFKEHKILCHYNQ